MTVYMFPGQGSQVKGMGKELFDEFPEIVKKADEILGFSIKELCLEDPNNVLNLTRYTQPALYTVNALNYYHMINVSGSQPDYAAGHSLGEYNALLAAGVYDFETGLRLVKKRGELMGKASNGAMAAVMKLDESQIRTILDKYGYDQIDIANLNSEGQTVISGKIEDIDSVKEVFEKEGAVYIKLKVSAAFHSRYMKDIADEFEAYMNNFSFSAPVIPVISNVTARPHDPEKIKGTMIKQLCSSVRWDESVKYLLAKGCSKFIELGPGKVLTKLVDKIKTEAPLSDMTEDVPNRSETLNIDNTSNLFKTAEEKVEWWNRHYPIGTVCTSPYYAEKIITRTKAMVLFEKRAVVYVENYRGYFDLDEIKVNS